MSSASVFSACYMKPYNEQHGVRVCVQLLPSIMHAHQRNSEERCAIQVGQTNHEKRAAKAEKKSARFAIMPILQAEEDRR